MTYLLNIRFIQHKSAHESFVRPLLCSKIENLTHGVINNKSVTRIVLGLN